ncbi:Hypothetical predicted protein [Olea europaea subsp. europaea]|uniref:Pectinesterase inhibitor domain-containing protein n=1 Tax=Olea europaea subsp. europaea TaxID=158383 RepID=A0A8S0TL01_OLEEU|nr:Hypothetical predicted protein [Olea europaea subsp. europaea]
MLTPSTLFVIFFLISITSHLSSATIPSERLSEKEKHKIVASDAITICLHVVEDISRYVNAIPNLQSIQLTQNQKLLPCVQSLNVDLSEVQSALNNLKHLKESHMLSYEHSLKHMTSQTITKGKKCSSSLKNEDKPRQRFSGFIGSGGKVEVVIAASLLGGVARGHSVVSAVVEVNRSFSGIGSKFVMAVEC